MRQLSMTAVILCPGSSLNDYRPISDSVVIGVNRAAIHHTCDYWVALDLPFLQKYQYETIGRPTIVTLSGQIKSLGRGQFIGIERDGDNSPTCFSATAALVFAGGLGCNRIIHYGIDWQGTADFDGIEAGTNRTPERWERERKIWIELASELTKKGVTISRGGPHGIL